MKNLTEIPQWKALKHHYESLRTETIQGLFQNDPQRFEKFSLYHDDLLLDFSKNKITETTQQLLLALANARGLTQAINDMFEGKRVNVTEQLPALHTALRNFSGQPLYVDEQDIMPLLDSQREEFLEMVRYIRAGQWKGYTGKPLKHLVNIGIGGSFLGPKMVSEALKEYDDGAVTIDFIANIDGAAINEVMKRINLETSLFIISSKSFTTTETLSNAQAIKNILIKKFDDPNAIAKHFIAITAKPERAIEFGIPPKNILVINEGVGGRFSVWSSIGFVVAAQVGPEHFMQFLQGAYSMDKHFRTSPLSKNIPVMLALLGIWYNNFFNAETVAILPYSERLHFLPAYIQQCDMESNGKSVTKSGTPVNYSTGPIVWGQQGTLGQHAFYQLLHQGTKMIPCDMIGFVNTNEEIKDHHEKLISNLLGQSRALVEGRKREAIEEKLLRSGCPKAEVASLMVHKAIEGDKSHNVILLDKLTPYSLGKIIAMYEHKIYVQGVIWDVNSFDQFGVELGKELAEELLPMLSHKGEIKQFDASINGLVDFYRSQRKFFDVVYEEFQS